MNTAYSLIDPDIDRSLAVQAAVVVRAGIYKRISKDDVEPGDPDARLAVVRQDRDCRAEAERLGWLVAGDYEDNDISATNRRKKRPAFERLIADLEAGTIKALVTWHNDRLVRVPSELERLIEVCERHGVLISTVRAGRIDLSTPSGRVVARILCNIAIYEVEHMVERVTRKHRELAEAGQDSGGGRVFGYEYDRMTLRAAYTHQLSDGTEVTIDEPEEIRRAAKAVLEGRSLRSIALDWTCRGVLSVKGGKWTSEQVRRILVSARISGRKETFGLNERGKRVTMGTIIGDAVWPPIIQPQQSDDLRRFLAPGRLQAPGVSSSSKHLLAGLLYCSLCGARMYALGRGTMTCYGCGKVRISTRNVEDQVVEGFLTRADGLISSAMHKVDDSAALARLARIETDLQGLADDWADERITRPEWVAARTRLEVRRKALSQTIDRNRQAEGLANIELPLRTSWGELSRERQRTILAMFMTRIIIRPAQRRGPSFDATRVFVEWKR